MGESPAGETGLWEQLDHHSMVRERRRVGYRGVAGEAGTPICRFAPYEDQDTLISFGEQDRAWARVRLKEEG